MTRTCPHCLGKCEVGVQVNLRRSQFDRKVLVREESRIKQRCPVCQGKGYIYADKQLKPGGDGKKPGYETKG